MLMSTCTTTKWVDMHHQRHPNWLYLGLVCNVLDECLWMVDNNSIKGTEPYIYSKAKIHVEL